MIAVLIGLLLAAGILEYLSLRHGLDKILYRIEPEKKLVEPGETFALRTTVENRKRFLVPYLRVDESVPQELDFLGENGPEEKPLGTSGNYRITSRCYLAGRQKAVFLRKGVLNRRGRYVFSETTLYAGDFLGISGKGRDCFSGQEIVVKPRPADSVLLDEALGGFLGEFSVRRFWMEDPMYLIGFRDYTGREPMRSISWPATAKTGRLMVKEFDHTAELSCLVICDISTRDLRRVGSEEQERCFSFARTVCEELENRGFSYGFLTNAAVAGIGGGALEYAPGMGERHLSAVLEALGRSTGYFSRHLEELLGGLLDSRGKFQACILVSLEEWAECASLLGQAEAALSQKILVLRPEDFEKNAEAAEVSA